MATTENKEKAARRVVRIPIRRRIVTRYRETLPPLADTSLPATGTPAFYQEQNRTIAEKLRSTRRDPEIADLIEGHRLQWRADNDG